SRIDEAPCGLLASGNLEAHHRTEPLLLTLRQLVLWMAGQTRIVDALDTGLLLKPCSKFLSAGAVRLHAQPQRFQPLEEYPGVERTERRPGSTQEPDHLLHLFATTGN